MFLGTLIPYSYTILFVGSALLSLGTILGTVHLRKSRQDGIQSWQPDYWDDDWEFYEELVLPLFLFEERYPTFGKIMTLVLERFPVAKFAKDSEFVEALQLLQKAAYSGDFDSPLAIESLCRIVGEFVRDSDVEYDCRPDLYLMLDQFLQEIDLAGQS